MLYACMVTDCWETWQESLHATKEGARRAGRNWLLEKYDQTYESRRLCGKMEFDFMNKYQSFQVVPVAVQQENEMAQEPMTYTKNQPTDNVDAWRLGEACRAAAADPKCGDPIDRGLMLLRELEAKGYGVVKLVHNAKLTGSGTESG